MGFLSWLRRRRLDEDDFRAEVESHLAMAAAERMADGADAKDARLASLKEFGNVTRTTESVRRVWQPRWVERLGELVNDVRYAVRGLTRNPAFSLTVIAVLTLGIGLNAAAFTLLKSIALTPLGGVDHAAQLRVVHATTSAGRDVTLSYPDYRDLREHDRAFSALLAQVGAQVNLGRGRSARPVSSEFVSGNYFEVLGVRAQIGRTFTAADEIAPSRHPVVVISDGLWRRDFAADPSILGRTIEVNNTMLTVAGVADPAFHGTIVSYDVELFIPLMMLADLGFKFGMPPETSPSEIFADRRLAMFGVMGYLRPGLSTAAARTEIETLWTTLHTGRGQADPALAITVVPFWRDPNSAQSYALPTVFVLSVMALLVLLIACANIAGLVLVRGVNRRGEIALRLALGAARGRLVRLLLVESLVLAIPGAVFGIVLAMVGFPRLVDLIERIAAPQRLYFNASLDGLVIAFAVVVGCGCALVFGLVPALTSSRVNLVTVINEDASTRGGTRGRMRAGLVVAQVAVSLLLLVGAGLVNRSLDAARGADPGFDARQVAGISLDLRQNGYDSPRGTAFYRTLLETARSQPGVESATLASAIPMAFLEPRAYPMEVDGYQPRRGEDVAAMMNVVGPDYFRTLRIPLRAGREFEDRDDETAQPAVIVNQTFTERYVGGAAGAIGKRIRISDGDWRTIVGVAADVKYAQINEAPRPYVYLPYQQSYRSAMALHMRGAGPVTALVESGSALVEAIDPDLPIVTARPLTDDVNGAFFFYNFMARVLFVFGAAGMALAAMGTYGVVSYVVRQRGHEIGIRFALGAQRAAVLREFLARGMTLGAIGAVAGVLVALALGQVLNGLLYGVSATDLVSFARAVAIVLGGVAAASLIPAWRAARTNPLDALRHQ